MSNPGAHHDSHEEWREETLIGAMAFSNATLREEHCERAGQLYLLAEILTALHRQAAATEKLAKQYESFVGYWKEAASLV